MELARLVHGRAGETGCWPACHDIQFPRTLPVLAGQGGFAVGHGAGLLGHGLFRFLKRVWASVVSPEVDEMVYFFVLSP